jgi:glycosyltransferase involved in cell wall biosynthesis
MVVGGNLKDGMPQIPTFVQSQAESLQNAGWEVVFGVVDDRTSVGGILRNVRLLKGEVAQANPNLVHAQYGSVTAAVASLIKGQLPLAVSFCGDDLLGTPVPGVGWRLRERCARSIGLWAARRAAAIIVKSDNLLQALPACLRVPAFVLPNGVDTSWFVPMARDECRAKLGWSPESRVVLFNASQQEDRYRKNPLLARATVKTLSRSVPNVSLHTLSNASRGEVRLTMNAADCLLVTSLHEGSPNIVKEAMACNLPIVAVPCGDVPDRLRRTRPGAVCPYDAPTLAEAIREVFMAGCRSNGREQLIAQGLTVANVAERLVQIYRRVQAEDPFEAKESA